MLTKHIKDGVFPDKYPAFLNEINENRRQSSMDLFSILVYFIVILIDIRISILFTSFHPDSKQSLITSFPAKRRKRNTH